MNIYKAKRLWYRKNGITSRMRWNLRMPGYSRIILPIIPVDGDPLTFYKEWAAVVTRLLGRRLPGNWTTSRGIKKRQKALMLLY